MTHYTDATSLEELVQLLHGDIALLDLVPMDERRSSRKLIALAGSPGVGKSTVAQAVLQAIGSSTAVVVPMDGFHLSNAALRSLGLADRKGAPDTFDRDGFGAALRRLREVGADTVWLPQFHREVEESFAAEIGIEPRHTTVIVEGNYLLLWPECAALFDRCWYLEAASEHDRIERLTARHVQHGRSVEAAAEWVNRSDEANARLVESSRFRSDLLVRVAQFR
jgi:pantothenate kinase